MENVEVFTAEGKGRGLKATKEFWAADVIFAERAYSAVVFDSLVRIASPLMVGKTGALLKAYLIHFMSTALKDRTIELLLQSSSG
ncbi:hypothetical protein P7K49_029332 [Saguinus oedipus]|uniref:Uncharacterized protein n=1 Tax=Saguinus oedipus TaxID=9490 RepID=A0ABQ9U6X4_SAGOE|nr:hypothetical protein P7K49_029332 [Saguinus oedipus]